MDRHSYATFIVRLIAAAMLLGASASAQRANPADSDRSPEVRRPGPLDPRIVGAWDVWISGAVTYSTDGRSVHQHYEPGAAMNRLEITSDGRYRWGGKTGRVVEVLPWHHQPGRRYYRVVHSSGSEYDFYHADGDRLVILFGGVGGHASTGTRLAGGTTSTPSVGARPGVTSATQDLGRGDTRSDRRAQPQSPNGNPLGVEWVGGGNANGSGSPRPSGNNPLGVEWVGGGNANGSGSPRPSSNNPLGVEWVGGGNAGPTLVDQNSKQSRPAGPAPRGPEPVEPTPTSAENLRSALTDRWLYQAVAFVDGTGTVAESRGVSGSLVFHSEGSYEQALSIGGILNAIKGSYRVTGTRMVMSYQWGGKASSDVLTIHLDDSGDKLTLVRQGSPTAYYTLRRAK